MPKGWGKGNRDRHGTGPPSKTVSSNTCLRRLVQPGNLDLFLLGCFAELIQRPSLNLPNPLLGDAHLGPHLLEGQRLATAEQPKPANDNLLFSLVKTLELFVKYRPPVSESHSRLSRPRPLLCRSAMTVVK